MESLLLRVRERIQAQETSRHLEYWLQDVALAEGGQGDLTLMCPNAFSVQWLSGRHAQALASLFSEEAGRDLRLTFQIDRSTAPRSTPGDSVSAAASDPDPPPAPGPAAGLNETVPMKSPFPGWNPRFRFSTFVSGRSNGFAWSAAKEVSRRFHSQYNPLLIHASTGLGKTHLGQAIGHRLFEENGNLRILWRTAESFLADMIRHIKDRDVPSFKAKYRDACDVLILDDIQFLKGKNALQAELCHTLDILMDRGKQVVLLGNLPPRGKNGLDEGLESRIFSGLAVTMEPPEFETRLAITRQFARTFGLQASDEVLEAVARNVRSHVRGLEGACKRLLALQSLAHESIDLETVERFFRNPAIPSRKPADPRTIRDHVAKYFDLAPGMLSSRSRQTTVHYPRQIGMYLARKHTQASLASIGHLYNRGHASVLNALRSLEKKMRISARVTREVGFIEEKLLEKI